MTKQVVVSSKEAQYDSIIKSASSKYGVPENLIKAVIQQESGYNNNRYSGKGAGGLMQLMPDTARGLGVTNVNDPTQNIMGGTKYLANAIKTNNGNIPLALAAYNAGQGRVNQAGGKIPNIAETQNYVKSIMANYGGNNIDPALLMTDSSGDSSGGLGSSIVNGIQSIFQTLFTDTVKVFIYIILFGLMVFFAYKALQGSPPASAAIQTTRKAGATAKKIVKTAVKVIPK
jgi:hypothetical protein